MRKIKSNIENILQILWEREERYKKKSSLESKIFGEDREGAGDEDMFADEEGGPIEEGLAGADTALGGAAERNAKKRKILLEKAPKILRL